MIKKREEEEAVLRTKISKKTHKVSDDEALNVLCFLIVYFVSLWFSVLKVDFHLSFWQRERENYHVGVCSLIFLLFYRKIYLNVLSPFPFPLPNGQVEIDLQ